jgi:hypothetical protein
VKIAYIILGCKKYIERKAWQESTWLSKIEDGDNYFYLIGDSGKSFLEGNIFYCECRDDYDSCPYKYLRFLSNFKDLDKYDGFFFCDDDTYVFTSRLKDKIESEQLDIMGRLGSCGDNRLSNQYCKYPLRFFSGGAGFFVSKPYLERIILFLKTSNQIPMSVNSDVTFGHWLMATGCDLKNMKDFSDVLKAQSPNHMENAGCNMEKVISMHYCTKEDFEYLFGIDNS